VLLEFTSARPPSSTSDGRWQRSYWPGAALFAMGLVLYLPDSWLGDLSGQVVAIIGGCLLANTAVVRRRAAAHAQREPRQWTITDDELRVANRLGSVRWAWIQVTRAVERPDVYLLYQSDSPHTAAFDVPRDTLTPTQDSEFRAFLADRGMLPVSSS
jgi:hypothetical protein